MTMLLLTGTFLQYTLESLSRSEGFMAHNASITQRARLDVTISMASIF